MMTMVTNLKYLLKYIYIYIYPNIFMVSWWGTDSYFSNKQIKISDNEIMTAVYGSSESFGSRVRSKSFGLNTYIGRRSNFFQNHHKFMDHFTNLI